MNPQYQQMLSDAWQRGMVDTPVVQGFQAVQNGGKVEPSFGAGVGGLMGSAYKNLIAPPIEAIQNLSQNMGGSQGQYVNGNYLPMNPQEMTQNAAEIGMLGMVGSGMMAPTNSLGMFGGKMAQLYPTRADALARHGVLTEAIDRSGAKLLERKNLPEFKERKEISQYLKDTRPAKTPRKVVEEPKGLMSGVDEYVGSHQAPSMDYGTTIDDLAKMYPEDIYSRDGLQYYGNANNANDVESYRKLMSVKGKPDADVTVYRAVPKGVDSINQGDWITLSESYAKQHGEAALNGDYDIIKTTAKAKDIVTDANDFNELGYWGKPVGGKESTIPPAERAENFKNWFGDSKVVDDAGNAETMLHGTNKDFDAFRSDSSNWFTKDSAYASDYAGSGEGSRVIPVNLAIDNPADLGFRNSQTDVKYSDMLGRVKGLVMKSFEKGDTTKDKAKKIISYINEDSAKDSGKMQRVWQWWEDKPELAKWLKDAGYDGITGNEGSGGAIKTFSPFINTQIKSINNSGAYNPTDPNIMRGGLMAPIPQGENDVR